MANYVKRYLYCKLTKHWGFFSHLFYSFSILFLHVTVYFYIERTQAIWSSIEIEANKWANRKTGRLSLCHYEPYKLLGIYGIYPIILQRGPDMLYRRLRSSLSFEYMPRASRDIRVTFKTKPGKTGNSKAPKTNKSNVIRTQDFNETAR